MVVSTTPDFSIFFVCHTKSAWGVGGGTLGFSWPDMIAPWLVLGLIKGLLQTGGYLPKYLLAVQPTVRETVNFKSSREHRVDITIRVEAGGLAQRC